MSNITMLHTPSQRAEDIAALQEVMPQCVKAAAADVGPEGVKAFFAGYKDSIETSKLAA
jgi:hypothetical protein